MDKPTNFNVARALKAEDARLMSVTDCLEDALESSRDGRWTKCLLVLYREPSEGNFTTDVRIAGCSKLEARGLMLSEIKEEFFD